MTLASLLATAGAAQVRATTVATGSHLEPAGWRDNAEWVTALTEAQERARRRGTIIFAYFTRSRVPCPASQELERGPLADPSFRGFAAGVVPFLYVSHQALDRDDRDLLRAKGGRHYPYLAFLDADGALLAEPRERSVDGFQRTLDALRTLRRLDRRDRPADDAAAATIFIARLELGRVELTEATGLARTLQLDAAQRRFVDQELINLTVADHFERAQRDRDYSKLGPALVAMQRAGRIPTGTWRRNFWSQVLQQAHRDRDADRYAEAYRQYRIALGNNRRYQRIFERYDAVLDALRRGEAPPDPTAPPGRPGSPDAKGASRKPGPDHR